MGEIARNSIKGYTYQQSVFILFLAIMDTERNISKITVEALDTKNFDDIYLQEVKCRKEKNIDYRIQAKNYIDTRLEDIEIDGDVLTIKGNHNNYEPSDNNILIVNTSLIETDDEFMGFACTKVNDIIIIPLTPNQIADKLDDMFSNELRELQIIHKADDITQNSKFVITVDELPDIVQMSIDLENETVLLRKIPDNFEHNILFLEGKPGVGKSHFVTEISENYPEAIIYRFWIGSQDPNQNRRIRFENFLLEMGIKVYKTAKKVNVDELINTIRNEDKIIIIDGLDHVENYNPLQLKEFIDFIDKLSGIRVLVLSRPLKSEIHWKKETLLDWSYDETRLYLEIAHKITDYKIQSEIYRITNGYPIISYFVAEDYKIKKVIDIKNPIIGINEYYDSLFVNNDKPSSAIGVFATGNCFFTEKELKSFFDDDEVYETICEFIDMHPYLFKRLMNRISLIHDSFNTYLRMRINTFEKRKEKTLKIIRKSILDGSIEYMDRMQSFAFDEEFYETMLIKYSEFDEFVELMLSTNDYNSIQSLYCQLQSLLEDRERILDIYQYYSFVLLYQIANRNNLIGNDSMILQMLIYIHNHGCVEDEIFSSDYIWQVYLTSNNFEKFTAQYINKRHISENHFYELIEHINEDCSFFEKKDRIIEFDELIEHLKHEDMKLIEKDKELADYLVSVWIHGNEKDKYYSNIVNYVNGDKKCIEEMLSELTEYKFDRFWIERSLSMAEYQLHELGYFGEKNKFRNISLMDIIKKGACEGSYCAMILAASYLKLANYEKRDVDISALAYAWSMYFNHKDCSVCTIDTALSVFEKKDLVKEEESFDIISRLMEQSDDGISHLLTSYVNKKGREYVNKLNETGYFQSNKCKIWFWELDTEFYSCFNKQEMRKQITELLSVHYPTKTIEGSDIKTVMCSDYRNMVLDAFEYYDYLILEPCNEWIPELERRGIRYIGSKEETNEQYIPFEHGCIHKKDLEYINELNISYTELAQYVDGWYSCLPFIDAFSRYNKREIQKEYLIILHNAMYARAPKSEYIGSWYLLLGNILEFLIEYEINVDWEKLYGIFMKFLDVSLIKHN